MYYILDKSTGRIYEILGDIVQPGENSEEKRPYRVKLDLKESTSKAAKMCAEMGVEDYELTDDPSILVGHRITYDQPFKLGLVRSKRNQLLQESDFIMLPDSPMADDPAWRTYRQELRDLPSLITKDTRIEDIQWPVRPGETGQ